MSRIKCLALVSILFVIHFPSIFAQCIEGNCYDGKGTYVYQSGAKYVGQFKGGKIHGQGILYFSNGNKYIGNWENQYREGEGRLVFINGDEYIGHFRKSKFNGRGTMTFANGDRYKGDWVDDIQHGTGKYYFANGDRYEGAFDRGKFNGQGTMYYEDGARFVGTWKNNKKNGQGTFYKTDGREVAGFWENGNYVEDGQTIVSNTPNTSQNSMSPSANTTKDLPNCNKVYCGSGKGILTYRDGSKYVGEFFNGNPQGQGTCFYANGDKYVGGWKNHAPHGEGIMYYKSGRVLGAIWEYGSPLREIEPNQETIPSEVVNVEHNSDVKIWAVVVGVARYTHMPVLKYTDDDAYQIYAFLKSPEGGALRDEQIRVLIDEEATRLNVLTEMRQTFLKADENDVVIFYFSGHGLPGSFLPVDFDGFNNKLRHEDIKSIFAKTRAKHKVCFADACHSGSLMASKAVVSETLEKYYKAFETSQGGTALLVSSKSDEYSLEDMGLRQGIFSHFLIKGLKGEADRNRNNIVTIQELFDYIYVKVKNYTANAQTPTITGKYDALMPVAAVR